MEIAQLVLEYLQVLIWPSVTVVGLLLFRRPLTSVLQRLKCAGLPGGVALDFDRDVRDAQVLSRDVAKTAPRAPQGSTPMLPLTEANARMITLGFQPSPSGLDINRYLDLAQQDPNLALAGLRMELEILVRNLAKGSKLEVDPRDSTSTLLRRLLGQDAITDEQCSLAEKIIRLCNAAVHGTRVSREEAEAVIDTARVLAKDYLAWLSWAFDDGWAPHGEPSGCHMHAADDADPR